MVPAPAPERPIDGSIATEALIAHVRNDGAPGCDGMTFDQSGFTRASLGRSHARDRGHREVEAEMAVPCLSPEDLRQQGRVAAR